MGHSDITGIFSIIARVARGYHMYKLYNMTMLADVLGLSWLADTSMNEIGSVRSIQARHAIFYPLPIPDSLFILVIVDTAP